MKTLSILFVATTGCAMFAPQGSARPVERGQAGGTLALQGDRTKAQADAYNQMAVHCGGPGTYTVVKEYEFVVGTDSVASADKGYNEYSGTEQSTAASQTRQATEYRLDYQCGATAAMPAPAPVPAVAPTN